MIQVGRSQVGGGVPYIIAEIGSNWKSFEDAYGSIEAAKGAGASAVKFQLFDHRSLYGVPKARNSGYDDSFDLPVDWLAKLKQRSDQLAIDFMVTCFNPAHVRVVDPMVAAHKVASSDINHISLLQELDKMGKPVFVSVGAATPVEIELAISYLSNVPVILMYCVSSYPAVSVDLTLIDALKPFSPYVGYSDHTTDAVYIPYAAVKFHGAVAIEKHMTATDEITPDSPHSVIPSKFKLMVDRISGKRRGILGPTNEEVDMVLRHKRRFVVSAEIKKGETLKFDKNFGAYRAMSIDPKGISPLCLSEVNGRLATRDIDPGESLAVGDFE